MTELYCYPHSGGLAHQLRPLARELAPLTFRGVDYPRAQAWGSPPGSVREFVADRLRGQDATDFGEAFLYGHSLGGLVAFETALQLERRGTPAAGVVIAAGVPGDGVPRPTRTDARTCTDDELFDWSFGTVRDRLPTPADREVFAAFAPRLRRDLRLYGSYRPDGRLARTPALLLVGTDDTVCPPGAWEHWAPYLTRPARAEVKGGHMFHLDDPAATAAAVRDWRAA
ncbi:thioesterase II family protein [Streptomyces pratensis]|uniref:thioesterase II family protein n=1 Tax=Streptomyces pratensis TaxID=1169025 RepID=UPI00363190BB